MGQKPRLVEERPQDLAPLGDLRFRKLLGEEAWFSLPPKVRARFSKRVGAGDTAVYVGRIAEMRLNFAGRVLVQMLRLVGGPLPLSTDTGTASVVTVTEDAARGGQVWTRLYARRRFRPQVIHSTKMFAGPTGLEEHVGCGIFMRLSVGVEGGRLVFRSAGYFLGLGPLTIGLPRLLAPGALTVTHAETGPDSFVFTLEIAHPRLGCLLYQVVEFRG